MRIAVFVLLTAVLSGCTLFGANSRQSDVNRAQQTWNNAAPSDYEFDLAIGCFCAYWPGPATVVVRADTVNALLDAATGEVLQDNFGDGLLLDRLGDSVPTIDGLFEIIKDALREGADDVEADYDPTYGYPTNISIDYLEHALINDFSSFIVVYDTLEVKRKNFLNIQYVLFNLLKKLCHPCDDKNFNLPKGDMSRLFHMICKEVFN